MSESQPLKPLSRPVVTLDPASFFPKDSETAFVDLKDFLLKGLILKESEFREQVSATDWSVYQSKYVGIICTADAIIPMWAYMVISAALAPFAKDIAVSHPDHLADIFMMRRIAAIDTEPFKDQRIVIKGCGERRVLEGAYALLTQKLVGVARSVMYGEPCSTVPVFRK